MILMFGFIFLFSTPVHASETDGTIDPVNKYAWSENIGWLNFGTGVGAGDVHVTDAGLTGYVWNEQKGWINLAPTNSGVMIDSAGSLDGFAWGEQTGYIDFSNASIDANGIFHGTATNSITGTITFDCTNCLVETDYRPADFRGGGGGGRRRVSEGDLSISEDLTSGGGGGGVYSSADQSAAEILPRVQLRLLDALKQLFAWMYPTDYQLLKKPAAVKKNLGMFMRMKHTMKLLAATSGYSDGYSYNKPGEITENVADLTKSVMVSFSECFSSAQMERAMRHDFVGNDYWWAGYWHFLNPLFQEFLKDEYQLWDGIDEINIFDLLDRFTIQYCPQTDL